MYTTLNLIKAIRQEEGKILLCHVSFNKTKESMVMLAALCEPEGTTAL